MRRMLKMHRKVPGNQPVSVFFIHFFFLFFPFKSQEEVRQARELHPFHYTPPPPTLLKTPFSVVLFCAVARRPGSPNKTADRRRWRRQQPSDYYWQRQRLRSASSSRAEAAPETWLVSKLCRYTRLLETAGPSEVKRLHSPHPL